MTPSHRATLDFIARSLARDGFSPSFAEIAGHLGVRSKSNVHRLTTALIERGYLRREGGNGRARSLVPTQLGALTAIAQIPTEVLRAELARRGETR